MGNFSLEGNRLLNVENKRYLTDYQKYKKNSSFAEGQAFFFEWAEIHLEGDFKSLVIKEKNDFKKLYTEISGRSELEVDHPFSKSLANTLYHAAKDALSQGLAEPAAQIFYALSHLLPLNYDISQGLGLAFQLQGQHSDAIQAFNNAINIHPQNFHAYLYASESYLSLEQFEMFKESIAESMRLIPKEKKEFLQHAQHLINQFNKVKGKDNDSL
jgi:tetratricopeptide (TPR) repeat protein